MLHETITLPLRVGVRATRLGVRVTARAAVAFGITRRLIAGSLAPASHGTAASARESSSTFGRGVASASPPHPQAAPTAAPAPTRVAPEALHEGVHRRRKTVLAHARRQLRSAYNSGSRAQSGRP